LFAVSRWTKEGELDATYGSAGACEVDAAGIAATSVGAVARMIVNPDGSLRVAFGLANGDSAVKGCTAGGGVDAAQSKTLGAGAVADAAPTSDGGMVVLSTSVADGSLQWRKFNATSALDMAVGVAGTVATGLVTEGAGLVVQPDGRVVVGGGTSGDFTFRAYLATGLVDASFGVQGTLTVPIAGTNTAELRKLVRQPDGRILAVGLQYNTADGALVRFWH
jgi:hypothetical protein